MEILIMLQQFSRLSQTLCPNSNAITKLSLNLLLGHMHYHAYQIFNTLDLIPRKICLPNFLQKEHEKR